MNLDIVTTHHQAPRIREIEASKDWELIKTLLEGNHHVLLHCYQSKPGYDVTVTLVGCIKASHIHDIHDILKQLRPNSNHFVAIKIKPSEDALDDELGY